MSESLLAVRAADDNLKSRRIRKGDFVFIDPNAKAEWGDVIAILKPDTREIRLIIYREQPDLFIIGKAVYA